MVCKDNTKYIVTCNLYLHCKHNFKKTVFTFYLHLTVVLLHRAFNIMQTYTMLSSVCFGGRRYIVVILGAGSRIFY